MSAKKAPAKKAASHRLTSEQLDNIKQADVSNLIRKVKSGKTLTAAERKTLEQAAGSEDDLPAELVTTSQLAQADTTQLCRLFNLTSARIGQLAKDGIIFKTERNQYDLWRSVRGYIEFLQKSKTEGASHMERSGTSGDPQELEELVRQVKAARTYNDARTLKVQIDALRGGYALEVEQERYCSIAQIEDGMDGIAAVVRNAIKRMEADLPPMLEGLDASAMKRLIAEKSAQVIQIIYDEGERIKSPIIGEIPTNH